MNHRRLPIAIFAVAVAFSVIVRTKSAFAYVEIPYTLGRVTQEANYVVVMRVERVDKERHLILYRKVKDVKGTYPVEVIKHNIGTAGFHPREWQNIMEWADVGKTAVFFHNGSASETCIDNYWYQANANGEWWGMTHAEPFFLRSFAGRPEKLATAVASMLAGQEAVVPCMVDGDKNALQLRQAKIQRLKASLKLQDYDAKRDFVGWGGEEFRSLSGMPPFSHLGTASRTDPGARGVAPVDFDGDGKLDLLLYGDTRTVLLQNGGSTFNEVPLPYSGGARAAAWADYNGDGAPDLLLATPVGPRLLVNVKGALQDQTPTLPLDAYYSLVAGAWIDYDADGRPDILLADRFRGLRLYHNVSAAVANPPAAGTLLFADVSDALGLGQAGIAGSESGDHLSVADVNGDGRPDFLYSAGSGVLTMNTPRGFVVSANSGIRYAAGGVSPVFADFDGDKQLDLCVPQPDRVLMFRNVGSGKFAALAGGDLARPLSGATSAAAGDFNGDGRPDLLIGCLMSPNRCFLNKGQGAFQDASSELGFYQKVFNTKALAVLDLNKDGAPDLVLNNEGQESVILLGAAKAAAPPAK